MTPSYVLVTGGGGFIGSHTVVALQERGLQVIVVDDHSTSSPAALDRVAEVSGVRPLLYSLDLNDRGALNRVFSMHRIDAVIHFAARKAVGESTEIPFEYFDVNIGGTASLLRVMHEHGVHRLVFSSSCSIYGDGAPDGTPLAETAPARPTNPYAWSKWACEQVIAQGCLFHPELRAISLRYFNPVGAHPSGLLGEDPLGEPRNLMPYLMQVAAGQRAQLTVFGQDYPTADGSAVRDYIHVCDVADGHLVALDHLDDIPGHRVINLGTGIGTSVLALRTTTEMVTGRRIPYLLRGRRRGDVAALIADAGRARREWGWQPRHDLTEMCGDAWKFTRANPHGYQALSAV
ncbi:UDP-glucose 4-epimerase GalE [Nocardia acidivorans]|uniref:UDP-glucose 4-epimerase GalE n=1 Tax=Nocardia acidivorans TaxID=404580 RepID=UPI000832FE41|nr:UDP-glucose 4-epimerase GalE [Nocardia acidivorans]